MNFNNYFKEKITSTKLNLGLTNDNFLIVTASGKKYFLKQYLNLIDNNEVILTHFVKYFDVPLYYCDDKVKITYKIKGLTLKQTAITNQKVITIANNLKKLHNQKLIPALIFDPFKMLDQYRTKIINPLYNYNQFQHIINNAKNVYQKAKKVLCHNDLVPGNILFNDKRLFIIDWEYGGLNDPLFDVVSFLNENNLYFSPIKKLFLETYFKNINQKLLIKLNIWNDYQNLLWCCWANMMYDQKAKIIYQQIAAEKMANLLK